MKRTQQTALSAKEREMTERALASLEEQLGQTPAVCRYLMEMPQPKRRKVKPLAERQAKSAEQVRFKPYAVTYRMFNPFTSKWEVNIYGYTDDPKGGMPLTMARLTPWAKNPRVVSL